MLKRISAIVRCVHPSLQVFMLSHSVQTKCFYTTTLIGPIYRKYKPNLSHLESVKFIPMLNHT